MKEVCTCFYIMPTYSQAKKVIWDSTTNDGTRILDFIPDQIIAQKNSQEMKIRFVNGSLFQLIGSENINSLMGTNPKIVIFSEYALQDPSAWDYIRPILAVNGGYAIFISTPRGKNHFWELSRIAEVTDGWFYERLTIEDTGVLTRDDYQKEIDQGMSEELALQEYFCSFERGIEGSYYSKLIYAMRNDGRITDVPYDPYKTVHTAWDLGWSDETAVIFWQIDGSYINIIDCEVHATTTLAEWARILQERKYRYGVHLFPHDVDQVDGMGSGCTRKELLADLGIEATTVPKGLIADGIEKVKSVLSSKMRISTKCESLIRCVEFYHREWDEKHKVYGNKPVHDWSSHFCDSLRYLCTGLHLVTNTNLTSDDDFKAVRSYWGADSVCKKINFG